jgi:hypothetical protein
MDAMLEVLTMVDLAISFNAATVVADLGILVCMFYLLQTRRQRIASYVSPTAPLTTKDLMNITVVKLAKFSRP